MTDIIHKELGYKIMEIGFTVHKELGPGLLESAYEEAMAWELKHAEIPFERQKVYPLHYKGDIIGGYIADLVVDNKIILEGTSKNYRFSKSRQEWRIDNFFNLL